MLYFDRRKWKKFCAKLIFYWISTHAVYFQFTSQNFFSLNIPLMNFYRPQQYLWKGNVFTGVCLSIGRRVWLGACIAGGHAWQDRRPLKQAVRILLECILVKFNLIWKRYEMKAVAEPRFPRGGADSLQGCKLFYFEKVLKETALKWKNFDWGGAPPPGIRHWKGRII